VASFKSGAPLCFAVMTKGGRKPQFSVCRPSPASLLLQGSEYHICASKACKGDDKCNFAHSRAEALWFNKIVNTQLRTLVGMAELPRKCDTVACFADLCSPPAVTTLDTRGPPSVAVAGGASLYLSADQMPPPARRLSSNSVVPANGSPDGAPEPPPGIMVTTEEWKQSALLGPAPLVVLTCGPCAEEGRWTPISGHSAIMEACSRLGLDSACVHSRRAAGHRLWTLDRDGDVATWYPIRTRVMRDGLNGNDHTPSLCHFAGSCIDGYGCVYAHSYAELAWWRWLYEHNKSDIGALDAVALLWLQRDAQVGLLPSPFADLLKSGEATDIEHPYETPWDAIVFKWKVLRVHCERLGGHVLPRGAPEDPTDEQARSACPYAHSSLQLRGDPRRTENGAPVARRPWAYAPRDRHSVGPEEWSYHPDMYKNLFRPNALCMPFAESGRCPVSCVEAAEGGAESAAIASRLSRCALLHVHLGVNYESAWLRLWPKYGLDPAHVESARTGITTPAVSRDEFRFHVLEYRTQECAEDHTDDPSGWQTCPCWHNEGQRRRRPVFVGGVWSPYSAELTGYGRSYHPEVYKSTICRTDRSERCPQFPWCSFAHGHEERDRVRRWALELEEEAMRGDGVCHGNAVPRADAAPPPPVWLAPAAAPDGVEVAPRPAAARGGSGSLDDDGAREDVVNRNDANRWFQLPIEPETAGSVRTDVDYFVDLQEDGKFGNSFDTIILFGRQVSHDRRESRAGTRVAFKLINAEQVAARQLFERERRMFSAMGDGSSANGHVIKMISHGLVRKGTMVDALDALNRSRDAEPVQVDEAAQSKVDHHCFVLEQFGVSLAEIMCTFEKSWERKALFFWSEGKYFPTQTATQLVLNILLGLDQVHCAFQDQGGHRDLRPENILVDVELLRQVGEYPERLCAGGTKGATSRGTANVLAKICDFGLARPTVDDPGRMPSASLRANITNTTKAWWGPEWKGDAEGIVLHDGHIEGIQKSDLYGAGAVIFHVLTGGCYFLATYHCEVAEDHVIHRIHNEHGDLLPEAVLSAAVSMSRSSFAKAQQLGRPDSIANLSKRSLCRLDHLPVARDLVERLVGGPQLDPARRTPAKVLLGFEADRDAPMLHPFFWSLVTRMKLIVGVAKYVKGLSMIENSEPAALAFLAHLDSFLDDSGKWPTPACADHTKERCWCCRRGREWHTIVDALSAFKGSAYAYDNTADMLRAVLNFTKHHDELGFQRKIHRMVGVKERDRAEFIDTYLPDLYWWVFLAIQKTHGFLEANPQLAEDVRGTILDANW
jgi:serine/threonine protein kinase